MIRPLTDTLRHIGGGIFIDVASEKLAELLTAAGPRIQAAEALEQRLREAGIDARMTAMPHDTGCAVMIHVTGARQVVLGWLEHFAVPCESLSEGQRSVQAYSVIVRGKALTLVITDTTDESAR